MPGATKLEICNPKCSFTSYVQAILKKSALIPAGPFKMNCTIKNAK